MRVIAGEAKGRRLLGPPPGTRPTADRVREALFNILSGLIPGSRVLDLYAGTGALGIEALSRGAAEACFVDRNPACMRIIAANLERTGLKDRARLLRADAGRAASRLAAEGCRFDLIFADPPYADPLYADPSAARKRQGEPVEEWAGLLAEDGWLIVEHDRKKEFTDPLRKVRLSRRERYGQTVLSFFRRVPD